MFQSGDFTQPEGGHVRYEPDTTPAADSVSGEKDGRPAEITTHDPATLPSAGAWRITTWPDRSTRREHGILRLMQPWCEFISDVIVADDPLFRSTR